MGGEAYLPSRLQQAPYNSQMAVMADQCTDVTILYIRTVNLLLHGLHTDVLHFNDTYVQIMYYMVELPRVSGRGKGRGKTWGGGGDKSHLVPHPLMRSIGDDDLYPLWTTHRRHH